VLNVNVRVHAREKFASAVDVHSHTAETFLSPSLNIRIPNLVFHNCHSVFLFSQGGVRACKTIAIFAC